MLKRFIGVLTLLAAVVAVAQGQSAPDTLTFYFIDVEGGQATLIVTPRGESLLVDSGYADQGRDASRIMAAIRNAGVRRIDHFLLTHFHSDHMGGIVALAGQVPVGTLYDHGALSGNERDTNDPARTLAEFNAYDRLRANHRHVEPRVGTKLLLPGVDDVTWVSTDGQVITSPLAGGGTPNPACPAQPPPADTVENVRSTGFALRFGAFRFVDLGDLSGAPMFNLLCPTARLGRVDLLLVPHHTSTDTTYPAVFSAFRPVTVIVNNGPAKGGQGPAFDALHAVPTLRDVWQLHRATALDVKNYPDAQIANLDTSTAYWLKVVAARNGSFTITNPRTGETRRYEALSDR